FTLTVETLLNVSLRTRRGVLSANGKLDLVYFNTYQSERSVNGFSQGMYEYRFNRLRPFVSFSALDTRERPSYEIDLRARRFEDTFHTGTDIRIGAKSLLQIGARRQTLNYAGDAIFLTTRLEDVLNRVTWNIS